MPRYFFHLQYQDRLVVDTTGLELPDLRAARGANAIAAKAAWADLFTPMLALPHRTTVITDAAGSVVFVLGL